MKIDTPLKFIFNNFNDTSTSFSYLIQCPGFNALALKATLLNYIGIIYIQAIHETAIKRKSASKKRKMAAVFFSFFFFPWPQLSTCFSCRVRDINLFISSANFFFFPLPFFGYDSN